MPNKTEFNKEYAEPFKSLRIPESVYNELREFKAKESQRIKHNFSFGDFIGKLVYEHPNYRDDGSVDEQRKIKKPFNPGKDASLDSDNADPSDAEQPDSDKEQPNAKKPIIIERNRSKPVANVRDDDEPDSDDDTDSEDNNENTDDFLYNVVRKDQSYDLFDDGIVRDAEGLTTGIWNLKGEIYNDSGKCVARLNEKEHKAFLDEYVRMHPEYEVYEPFRLMHFERRYAIREKKVIQ